MFSTKKRSRTKQRTDNKHITIPHLFNGELQEIVEDTLKKQANKLTATIGKGSASLRWRKRKTEKSES